MPGPACPRGRRTSVRVRVRTALCAMRRTVFAAPVVAHTGFVDPRVHDSTCPRPHRDLSNRRVVFSSAPEVTPPLCWAAQIMTRRDQSGEESTRQFVDRVLGRFRSGLVSRHRLTGLHGDFEFIAFTSETEFTNNARIPTNNARIPRIPFTSHSRRPPIHCIMRAFTVPYPRNHHVGARPCRGAVLWTG